jgi:uncharacterized membrane protein
MVSHKGGVCSRLRPAARAARLAALRGQQGERVGDLVKLADRPPSSGISRAAMRWIIAAFYSAAGFAHLWVPSILLSITPNWVPFAPQVIFLTGLFEFAASVALITRPLRYWAGIAMAIYAVCVWPANIKQAIDGILIPHIPDSWWYHGPRIALQPVIAWWALYSAGVIDWPRRRQRSSK